MALTLAPETASKIRVAIASGERIEVRDASGFLVETLVLQGTVRPVDPLTGPLPPTVPWEEMRRRAAERGGRTTPEIVADLEAAARQR